MVMQTFEQLVLLLGYYCLLDPSRQSLMHQGPNPLIQRLAAYPFHFFLRPNLKLLMLPLLVIATHNHPTNTALLQRELHVQFLTEFLESSVNPVAGPQLGLGEEFALRCRFPQEYWSNALEYLRSVPEQSVS
eukprot:c14748_g1_i3.p1 GENE.c14748_g1_i3~~c14748_g1_i3.p1  ORF type:complete len:132 (-),score=22.80 c14748_g1_i3:120-515(-)